MMNARLAVRIVRDSWRGITRRQMLATFLLGVALNVYHIASWTTDNDPFEWIPYLTIFLADQIKVWPLLLAFCVVEHIGSARRTAAWRTRRPPCLERWSPRRWP